MAAAGLMTLSALAQPQLSKDNIDEVLAAMTLQEKATLLVGGARAAIVNGVTSGTAHQVPGAAGNTRPIERLGIPGTVLADGPAGLRISPTREGANQTFYCTGFPVGTLLASSWDTALVEEVTNAMGEEVHEYGVDVLLAPGMNIHRNPLCGRNFEYFSEDPLLSGKMAAAYVRGIQKNDVGTSIKHYAVNNQETNRNENDARVSERALREIYLKNFEIAVKESAPWTVMSSYNQLNGEYTQQKKDLLTTILRDEWGYKGIVMTDWGNKAGTVKSAWSGNDLMEPGNQNEIDRIVAGVQDGSLDIKDVDRNVRRMLEYIVKTPSFKNYKFSNKPDLKAHAAVARRAAGEAMVLLRNEGVLPLKGGQKMALYGVSALDFVAGGTGSGDVNKAYVVNMEEAMTGAGFTLDKTLSDYYKSFIAYDKAQQALSGAVSNWFSRRKLAEIAIPENAIQTGARNNDVAVIVIGRNAGEGADRRMVDDFELTNIERDLVRNVSTAYHAAGKKVIVVLNVGGVIETNSWKNLVDAILLPWSPGQEGANAVADVLTGKVNPSGKLPMTFPVNFMDHPSSANFPFNYVRQQNQGFGRGPQQPVKDVDYTEYEEGIYVGYRYFSTAGVQVSYPFGYGLSYTSFSYTKPSVKATADGFTATVTVTNTGSVAGKEVVELYVTAPEAGLAKPACELKAFAKTRELKPGESQTLTMTVRNYDIASFNEANSAWEAPAGVYAVHFASNVEDVRASAVYTLRKAQSWKTNNLFELNVPLEEITVTRK
ncbi:MAG: glycoside hydrolase family 3 C-terminal domain-containing protein [Bacteroidales bacterium]|nr:glycoside hydrolase family 3 C-terminal domain-containing protein [Bacteroidales bacterium]MBR1577427.1 glycoside hydrolase family 3 C-terminal domain-containing protein [Bacteroidales bacterium]